MAKELYCDDCGHEWRSYELSEICPNCGSHETGNFDNFFEKEITDESIQRPSKEAQAGQRENDGVASDIRADAPEVGDVGNME